MIDPESPFRSTGSAMPRGTVVRVGSLPKAKPAFSLLAGVGFADLQAHAVRDAAAHEQRYLALRLEGLDDAAARAELAEFTAYARTMPWPMDLEWREWQNRRATKARKAMKPFTWDRPSIFGHAADAAMHRAGADWPVAPCACHPLPNPAGRDYRRRTKHRNRRKR